MVNLITTLWNVQSNRNARLGNKKKQGVSANDCSTGRHCQQRGLHLGKGRGRRVPGVCFLVSKLLRYGSINFQAGTETNKKPTKLNSTQSKKAKSKCSPRLPHRPPAELSQHSAQRTERAHRRAVWKPGAAHVERCGRRRGLLGPALPPRNLTFISKRCQALETTHSRCCSAMEAPHCRRDCRLPSTAWSSHYTQRRKVCLAGDAPGYCQPPRCKRRHHFLRTVKPAARTRRCPGILSHALIKPTETKSCVPAAGGHTHTHTHVQAQGRLPPPPPRGRAPPSRRAQPEARQEVSTAGPRGAEEGAARGLSPSQAQRGRRADSCALTKSALAPQRERAKGRHRSPPTRSLPCRSKAPRAASSASAEPRRRPPPQGREPCSPHRAQALAALTAALTSAPRMRGGRPAGPDAT